MECEVGIFDMVLQSWAHLVAGPHQGVVGQRTNLGVQGGVHLFGGTLEKLATSANKHNVTCKYVPKKTGEAPTARKSPETSGRGLDDWIKHVPFVCG